MNNIDYLIVSSTIDFSTDLVCYRLLNDKKRFYRLNRDNFNQYNINVNFQTKQMEIIIEDDIYIADFERLKGIYFRAPVFLRAQSKKTLTVEEQLEKSQWSSFIRNLIVFENAVWINNPVNTYRAENKMYQLAIAKECGMKIPETYVSNSTNVIKEDELYIVKSLDTALFYDTQKQTELFTYSNVISGKELKGYDLHNAPVFIQEFLNPKVDCRITYVMGKMYPVQILKKGNGVYGDWRFDKEKLDYVPFSLPETEKNKIVKMMNRLDLNFGGIDLAFVNGEYYFIEVNPTGEWGWLESNTGCEISKTIASALCQENEKCLEK